MNRLRHFAWFATIVLLLAASALWSSRLASRYQSQLRAQPGTVIRWEQHLQQSRRELDVLRRRLDATRQLPGTSKAPAEPAAALDSEQASEVEHWVRQVRQLQRAFAQHPQQTIPELAVLDDRAWLRLARRVKLDTDDNRERAFAITRNEAKSRFVQWLLNALNRYVKENHGLLPIETAELRPYFDPTLDPALFAQYEMVRSGKLSDAPAGPVLKAKTVVNEDYDGRLSINQQEPSSLTYSYELPHNPEGPPDMSKIADEMRRDAESAIRAFVSANHGTPPASPALLIPFFDPPLGPLMTEKLTHPLSAEDQLQFQADVAKVSAGHRLP